MNILLKIDDTQEYPELNWTLYEGWLNGISFHDVNVYEYGYYTYQLVDQVLPYETSYVDDLTQINVEEYCYQIKATGNDNIMVCERGVSFGYNNLVSDMRSLVVMQETGAPVGLVLERVLPFLGGCKPCREVRYRQDTMT